MIVLWFCFAAAAGAVIRWWCGRFNSAGRPWGTLGVNVIAALTLGLVVGSSADTLTIVGVGHLGALSTFSTWMKEISGDLGAGHRKNAIAYIVASLVLGVGAAAIGLELG